MKLCNGFFKANEKGLQYPPEFSHVFKGINEKDEFIEIALEQNTKELDR